MLNAQARYDEYRRAQEQATNDQVARLKQTLDNMEPSLREKLKWPPREDINKILEGTGITLDQLKVQNRSKKHVYLRQHIFWMLHTKHRWSFPKIGIFFNRDHTTVLHGVRAHAERLKQEELNANND